jgi:hypothetical protein
MANKITRVCWPGGVADTELRLGFVGDTIGAVHALNIDTGELLWRTEVAARPLAIFGNGVVALLDPSVTENDLMIITLDESTGIKQQQEFTLVFPEWVSATVEPSDTFKYEVGIEGNKLHFNWEAQQRYRGGAPPPDYLLAQQSQAGGTMQLDLASNELTTHQMTSAPERPMPEEARQALIFPYQCGASSQWLNEPWIFDGHSAVISGSFTNETQTLSLLKWRTGSTSLDSVVEILTGKALVAYVTADGQFIFIHSELPDERSNQKWWVFSVSTGQRIALLEYEDGAKEPCVLDTRLYYLDEDPPPSQRSGGETLTLKVKAVDISSSALLWEKRISSRPTQKAPALRP